MTAEKKHYTLLCRGQVISLENPAVMGILNITPDSFYDGGKYSDTAAAVHSAEQMLRDGATWIDIGAVSSRPSSQAASYKDEKQRLEPVLSELVRAFPDALLSVDTFRADIAQLAVEKYGVCMINDISAGYMDSEMLSRAARLNVPYIAMHMRGTPETMQSAENTTYSDVVNDLIHFFVLKKTEAEKNGIRDLLIDPGFGFSKTLEQNYTLLKSLSKFQILDCPIVAGLSRKSMIYKTLGNGPEEALSGTLAAETLALLNGADILRVHDVKETMHIIKIFKQYSMS